MPRTRKPTADEIVTEPDDTPVLAEFDVAAVPDELEQADPTTTPEPAALADAVPVAEDPDGIWRHGIRYSRRDAILLGFARP